MQILTGACLTALGVVGTVAVPFLPLGAPFYAAGLPLLVTSHKTSRLTVSRFRARFEKLNKAIEDLIGSRFIKSLPFTSKLQQALKATDPAVSLRFSAVQTIRIQSARKPALHTQSAKADSLFFPASKAAQPARHHSPACRQSIPLRAAHALKECFDPHSSSQASCRRDFLSVRHRKAKQENAFCPCSLAPQS